MATNRTSAGDPARTLALLWRRDTAEARRRGPRQALSVDAVVREAIAIADAEGLDALSMRRLADGLGIAPMAVYTYVPGRAELLDLMLDTLYARMRRRKPRGTDWRTRVAAVAEDNRALFRAHPWLAQVSTTRPPLGPGLMAKFENELRAFEGAGLDDVACDSALTFLLGFVESCARAAADVRATQRDSKMGEKRWWAANQPLLARVLDPAKYPTAARVGAAAGEAHGAAYDPEHAWTFGLARVLDGIAALVPTKQAKRRIRRR